MTIAIPPCSIRNEHHRVDGLPELQHSLRVGCLFGGFAVGTLRQAARSVLDSSRLDLFPRFEVRSLLSSRIPELQQRLWRRRQSPHKTVSLTMYDRPAGALRVYAAAQNFQCSETQTSTGAMIPSAVPLNAPLKELRAGVLLGFAAPIKVLHRSVEISPVHMRAGRPIIHF